MTKAILTQSHLKELIHYCQDAGTFTRIKSPYKAKIGVIKTIANSSAGYFQIMLNGKPYKAHRLAWLYIHGNFPENDTDHINGIRTDNRLVNIREATHAENMQNVGLTCANTSGYKGVSYHKSRGKWYVRISIDGKQKNLGYFNTPESASQAYEESAKIHHAEFYYRNN